MRLHWHVANHSFGAVSHTTPTLSKKHQTCHVVDQDVTAQKEWATHPGLVIGWPTVWDTGQHWNSIGYESRVYQATQYTGTEAMFWSAYSQNDRHHTLVKKNIDHSGWLLKSYIKNIFYPLEIVGRGSGTQFQVGKKFWLKLLIFVIFETKHLHMLMSRNKFTPDDSWWFNLLIK